MERLISFFGIFVMLGLAWLMSSHKRKFPWRLVGIGMGLQLAFALIVLRTEPGNEVFEWVKDLFVSATSSVDPGAEIVFGKLSTEDGFGAKFAFRVLPTIIFFSAIMAVFYHYGVMQMLIEGIAFIMQKTMRVSGAESLSSAANIFVGQTEAPLVIGPYVPTMTRSELMTVMVGGFATVAGSVLGAFVEFGIDAGHLLTASVISAPAALVIAKILQPEVDEPKTLGRVQIAVEKTSVNGIDAAARGTIQGVKLAINVAAMIIAFLALIALADKLVGWIGGRFDQTWSFTAFFSYVFRPFAWLMGIEWKDCLPVGQLLGQKMMANEFVAYIQLGEWMKEGSPVQLSERSQVIATYALCGFANFSSIGIQIGGIGPLAPNRQGELAQIGLRAMLGGTLAAFTTACIAGMLL